MSKIVEESAQEKNFYDDQYHDEGLKRSLGKRQLAFISIGAAIGTGIFLGTGKALKDGGPLGLLLGYLIMSTVVLSVICCLGEMISFLPIAGGHLTLSERFVDSAFSAAVSYTYCISWSLTQCAELSAAAILISFWNDDINPGVWISIFMIWILFVNVIGAKFFGISEQYFTLLKLFTIAILIITGIIISAGGGPNSNVKAIGFRYWRDPGPLVQYHRISGSKGRFLGFFAVLLQAAFSLIGSELLAIAAAETRHPRKALPLALNTVWIRIIFFYLTSVSIIGIIVASNDPNLGSSGTANASPFVIAIKNAGIKTLPSVINALIMLSAISAASADLYTSSRSLHSLARRGMAPKIFRKTTSNGTPLIAMLVCWSFSALSFLSISDGSSNAFEYFSGLTSVGGILGWFSISLTYLRFHAGMKKQDLKRNILPWHLPFNLTWYMAIWSIFIISIVCLFCGWTTISPFDPSEFFSKYMPIFNFITIFICFKVFWKTKFVTTSKMDFHSGLKEIEKDSDQCELQDKMNKPKTYIGKVKKWWLE